MISVVYNLPEIHFVGGETQHLLFNMVKEDGKKLFNAENCEASFSVLRFSNDSGDPIIDKSCDIIAGDEGIKNIASVRLESIETYNLYGRYIYQLTLIDKFGHTDIPGHGILNITRNINPKYIERKGVLT